MCTQHRPRANAFDGHHMSQYIQLQQPELMMMPIITTHSSEGYFLSNKI